MSETEFVICYEDFSMVEWMARSQGRELRAAIRSGKFVIEALTGCEYIDRITLEYVSPKGSAYNRIIETLYDKDCKTGEE